MNKKSLIPLFLIFILSLAIPAHAGFIVKKAAQTAGLTTVTTPAPRPSLTKKEQRKIILHAIKERIIHPSHFPDKRVSQSGWEGIVALCCGILGLWLIFPAIPAIIFGAIGMGRGHKNRGIAIAGFVLGLVTVLLAILAIIFFIAIFSAVL